MTKEKETKSKYEDKDKKIISHIKAKYDLCKTYYAKELKRMQLLDATDKGNMWKALNIKFPSYQILPDTNFVTYVKNNILASIYTVVKSASIQPTSEQDKNITAHLNIALEAVWDLCDIGQYQFQAGERAALLNIGITQVGWDDTLTAGSQDSFYKGNVSLKNISPMKFMRDPFATSLDTAGYCMTFDRYHKSVFLDNPNYKDAFKKYLESKRQDAGDIEIPTSTGELDKRYAQKDYHTLLIFWEKCKGQVNEYHIVDNAQLLYKKENIQPAEFPFAILYCNEPADALIGVSECAKIFANNVAYNLLDSLTLTAEYKNQNPPKFISSDSGLNIHAFAKHGDEANHTFIVNGRADQAVHYHQFPQPSNTVPILKNSLETAIQSISGVDGRYTGRNTGSIITTGGVEEMLNRVTLIDTPKITLYEKYTKQLSKLILSNLLHYAPKRKYFRQRPNSPKWESFEVDFPKIDNDTLFQYALNISSELPKNKQRISAMATMLMEKQMQYNQQGTNVQLITEEEWLMCQDLPNKEYMLERMGLQRLQDAVEETAQVISQYGELLNQGVDPNTALMSTAQTLQDKRAGNIGMESLPGSIQAQETFM